MAPIVTDPKQAANALNWAVGEMEQRYRTLARAGVRNIGQYNKMVTEEPDESEAGPLPYIVVIVDELADLMLTTGKEVETSVTRLAQMARAIGIHLILATQRPSVDVITGLIKANFPSRISFRVSSRSTPEPSWTATARNSCWAWETCWCSLPEPRAWFEPTGPG